jgi:hypothetical protein
MRTPLRLALRMQRARFAPLADQETYPPVYCIRVPQDPATNILSPADHKIFLAAPDRPRRQRETLRTPTLWLTGEEDALAHTGIARVARELQETRRTVFLATPGTQLRRRIHEFHPNNRLYLTIRLLGAQAAHDRRMQRDGAFALAMEGVRAAQLSGFLVCAQLVVDRETQMPEIEQLLRQLRAMKFDGVVTTASLEEHPEPLEVRGKVYATKSLLQNAFWASLSTDVEHALAASLLPPRIAPHLQLLTEEPEIVSANEALGR